jgi:hypothetical protein
MNVKTMTPKELEQENIDATLAIHFCAERGKWPDGWSLERYKTVSAELLARLRSEEAGRKQAQEVVRNSPSGVHNSEKDT